MTYAGKARKPYTPPHIHLPYATLAEMMRVQNVEETLEMNTSSLALEWGSSKTYFMLVSSGFQWD